MKFASPNEVEMLVERDDDAGGGGGRGGDGGGDEGGVFHRFDLRSTLKLRRPNVACFSKTLFRKKKKEEEKEEDFFSIFKARGIEKFTTKSTC